MSALEVFHMLDEIFTAFDAICSKYDVFRVDVVGDAYLAISGVRPDHDPTDAAASIARCALDMQGFIARHAKTAAGDRVRVRMGLHSGRIIAGIVGKSMPKYTIFGTDVNLVAKLETSSEPGRIQMSSAFSARLGRHRNAFWIEPRVVEGGRAAYIETAAAVYQTQWLFGHARPAGRGVLPTDDPGDASVAVDMEAHPPRSLDGRADVFVSRI